MTTRLLLVGWAVAIGFVASGAAEDYVVHSFERRQLTDQFTCEGATAADINRDGKADLVAGPYWYEGPEFTIRHEIYPPKAFDIEGYSDNFFAFAHDFNSDRWLDVLVVGFPGKEAVWYENPGGSQQHWQRHPAVPAVDNESPTFVDITGDGEPELVFHVNGQLGYAEYDANRPGNEWHFTAISPDRGYDRFNHGLGVGDVNGDGRADLLEKQGWWEQPETVDPSEFWGYHAVPFADAGGAQMYTYDFDDDGDNDVVTSKAAHAYGLSWFEQVAEGRTITFREHRIMGESPEENDYGIAFSQLHAVALADINNDGIKDIVTGKRFWAHSSHDPGSLDPPVSYWFQTVRENGKVRFIPHLIDAASGVGTQVVATNLNGDKWPDIVVGNKKGTFALIHHAKEVDKHAWDEAQPERTIPGKPVVVQKSADAKHPEDGYQAKDSAGRVLNLDFETGDLTDWTVEGDAFEGQPVEGDTVHVRRSDMVSGHQGKYWIGTYERAGDSPQGSLTSVSFPVEHPYASFLVGGGAGRALGTEIVSTGTGEVIFRASGHSQEEMQLVVVDLRQLIGKEIYIRIIDRASTGWAHTNFDHFRFHDEQPKFSHELKSVISEADYYPYAGLPADEAARVMKLPEGFRAISAAAEPDVKQPIAMAFDDRGRVWIAEAYEYPLRAPEGEGNDRILIFEDTDGDGSLDSRKVFAERLNLVSGLEVGFGGVWVGAAPYLMFIPDSDGDDVPDGEPKILLEGWAYQDTHETLNTFIWGPDGWLYGCHGVFTHSRVGKPGTPDAERIPLNAAIWRYHPTRHEFEIFAEGTSNPWGVDFDDYGQAFATACVIPHLYHIIPGARYQRQAGSHFNPHTYADIQTIADHLHYLGGSSHARNDSSGAAGGGHAHSGAMIYLGDSWPDEYRGRIFMNNIHGQRLNTDILKPRGSGFVGSHGPDFLLTGDLASQILNIRYGPDGNAWFIDWYDTNACHHNTVEGHDRSNGRIYKICYGDPKPVTVNLHDWSDLQLAEAMLEKNDWYVRHARRILQERAAERDIGSVAIDRLIEIATKHAEATRRLRAIWALHVIDRINPTLIDRLLVDESAYVRGWAIQLALENAAPSDTLLTKFADLSKNDPSPVVRLYLTSAIQRIELPHRWDILTGLASHAEDVNDHNLPLMIWYAAEPLVEVDTQRALSFGLSCGETMPRVREFVLRRIASLDTADSLALLVDALGKPTDSDEQLAILKALQQALEGQRLVKPPATWSSVYERLANSDNAALRNQTNVVGIKFGDPRAFTVFRDIVKSGDVEVSLRRNALSALLAVKDQQLAVMLQGLLTDSAMRDLALNGLALYDDASTPQAILSVYDSLSSTEKQKAISTLASRAPFAVELLKAVQDGLIPKIDLAADIVRQLSNFKNDEINALLTTTWGQVRISADDKLKLMADYRKLLSTPVAAQADPELGRAVFNRTCQQCHTLYGVGNKIGPDLTGSNRSDAEYLLTNIVDPSALISKEYQTTNIITDSGRVATGIVSAEDNKSVTVLSTAESLVIPKDEIDERQLSDASMMPDNQLAQFTDEEILALFAYLRGKNQVPMRALESNASLIFNGRDLAGWNGDQTLWSVENGEIVGKTDGLEDNSFLLSDLTAEDFHLSLEVMLKNNTGNSGIQFRSQPIDGFQEVAGYQADIGVDWWGRLYEENGRALLWDKSGEQFVLPGEWNKYEIRAQGSHIQTWLNGHPCVELDDPKGKRRGIFALQLHSGGPTEVRFRNFELKVLPGSKKEDVAR